MGKLFVCLILFGIAFVLYAIWLNQTFIDER
jgi:hypothetical protein